MREREREEEDGKKERAENEGRREFYVGIDVEGSLQAIKEKKNKSLLIFVSICAPRIFI